MVVMFLVLVPSALQLIVQPIRRHVLALVESAGLQLVVVLFAGLGVVLEIVTAGLAVVGLVPVPVIVTVVSGVIGLVIAI